ncbi:MAG: 30S ribosomal protein S16 [Parcubacteria group bacterium]|jgi:small subunit ribosomal protein S16
MLTIRFARTGRRNRAQYQIVLQEHTIAPGGRHIEVLGSFDPHSKKAVLKEERIKYWLGQGAQASDTAFNLFLGKGLATGDKRKVKMPAKKVEAVVEEAKAKEPAVEVAEAPKTEEAAVETPVVEEKVEEKKEEVKAEEKVEEVKAEEVKEEAKAE